MKKYTIQNIQKDPYDKRDYLYDIPVSVDDISLPTEIDHRIYAGGIENQGHTGSCVANSTVSALEILLQKADDFVDLSRLFLYYNIREPYEDLNEQDKGAYLRDAFKSIYHQGICTEDTWPFIEDNVNVHPDDASYQEALLRLCTKYERVLGYGQGILNNASIMKYVIAKGYPVTVSMQLGKTFFDINGELSTHNYEGVKDDLIGGHAMCVVGYDDSMDSFIVENSWGSDWGDNGYCAIKYQVMVNDLYDCWVCTEFAGHVFEDEFDMNITPMVTQDEYTLFNFTDKKRDYNKYCLAEVSGGKPPYTFKFQSPMGTVYQEESDNQFFYINNTIPTWSKTAFWNYVVCYIRDSNVPYQQAIQTFRTWCTPDPVSLDVTEENVTSLYVAYFNRVPDKEGLDYWLSATSLNSILDISNTFYDIAISSGTYPVDISNGDFVTLLYKNLFDRVPEEEGFNYWVSELDSGNVSHGELTLTMINAAWGPTKIYLDNKVEVSKRYVKYDLSYDLTKITSDVETVRVAIDELLLIINSKRGITIWDMMR